MDFLSILVSTISCTSLPTWACDAQLKTGLDPRLLYAVCYTESSGNEKAFVPEDGHSASYGVCQIKLSTARLEGFGGSGHELMHPATNALYAAKYISKHIRRYQSIPMAVSAYNAGRAIAGNQPYVRRVMRKYAELSR